MLRVMLMKKKSRACDSQIRLGYRIEHKFRVLTSARVFFAQFIEGESDNIEGNETSNSECSIELRVRQVLQSVDDDLVAGCSGAENKIVSSAQTTSKSPTRSL